MARTYTIKIKVRYSHAPYTIKSDLDNNVQHAVGQGLLTNGSAAAEVESWGVQVVQEGGEIKQSVRGYDD